MNIFVGGYDYIIDFFAQHAIDGLTNIYGVSRYLLIVLGIITLATNWSFYEGEVRLRNVFTKIFHFSGIYLCINSWNWITEETFKFLGEVGVMAATGNSHSQLIKASDILNLGFKLSNSAWQKIEEMSFFSSSAGDIILLVAAASLTVLAFYFIAFQFMLSKIVFYILSVATIILLPFGLINFLQSYFQKAIGGIINLGIRIMIMFYMIGTLQNYIEKLTISVGQNVDISILQNALIILALGYLTYKIPELAADILSGNPSFGNSATAFVGAAIGGAVGSAAKDIAKGVYHGSGFALNKAASFIAPGLVSQATGSGDNLSPASVQDIANMEQAFANNNADADERKKAAEERARINLEQARKPWRV